MPDYNINLTLQSIWETSRLFIDVLITWFVIYYAIKFVRNNARTIQIFKGIVLILAINGIAKVVGLKTVTYFSDTFIKEDKTENPQNCNIFSGFHAVREDPEKTAIFEDIDEI